MNDGSNVDVSRRKKEELLRRLPALKIFNKKKNQTGNKKPQLKLYLRLTLIRLLLTS